jgi:hypothetical protein
MHQLVKKFSSFCIKLRLKKQINYAKTDSRVMRKSRNMDLTCFKLKEVACTEINFIKIDLSNSR